MDACQKGMTTVGKMFEDGEYFVGDLIFAGEIMVEAMDIIKPALAGVNQQKKGRMILCTVKDDLHDIGKNIVKAMLEAGGFDVLDLGIDVPPEKVVETAKAENIKIIGLSGVLTLALDSMKDTINAFKDAGMRDDVKIIIGGNPVSDDACKALGADDWAYSPEMTLNFCSGWAVSM
jgi:methylmalonyl-CoA mutase cobalamin-binding domain/chain